MSEENAILVATSAPQAILQLIGQGSRTSHFVVSDGLGNGKALIRDTNFGGTYTVDADWVREYVAGAVFRG